MDGKVIDGRHRFPQQEFEEVDTSVFETTKKTARAAYKLGGLLLSRTVGVKLPFTEADTDRIPPKRHVELDPDHTLKVETIRGSEHFVDIYGLDYLYDNPNNLAPLVMIMPLSLPHNKGFQAPVIDEVQKHAREQQRPVLVISSEGFGDKPLPIKEVMNLDFDQMTDNINEVLDIVEQRLYVEIPSIHATGCSRGGTLSLLLASKEASSRRNEQGLKAREVEGVVAVAPAGLRRLDSFQKKFKVFEQFCVNEPFHILRKASTMGPQELYEYFSTLRESAPKLAALPPVGWTGLQFLLDVPLENIGQRLNPDMPTTVLTMKNDGITTPKHWDNELSKLALARIVSLPGHHVSIDSVAKVASAITGPLNDDLEAKPAA